MKMNEENKSILEEEKESSVDYVKIFKDLLKHKKLYAIVLPVAFVLAAIYALAQPNFYNCTVKLSPEMSSGRSSSSGLASLASSFGVNLGSGASGTEALFPTLYPDLMNSITFQSSLFDIPVQREDNEPSMTYYDYLLHGQKSPWWNGIFSLFKSSDDKPQSSKVNLFHLTPEQSGVMHAIANKVVCDVDKKTMMITISVTDQDPDIAATIADSACSRLQRFITDYRTSKVRVDLAYYQKLAEQSHDRYQKARQRYAEFMDANQDVILQTVRQKQVDLENEMQLQYNAYQQVAAQLLTAEAKVQEEKPAFTVLQPATVPLIKAGPKRAQMCLIFLFLAFLATTAWILYKEDDLKPLLGLTGSDD